MATRLTSQTVAQDDGKFLMPRTIFVILRSTPKGGVSKDARRLCRRTEGRSA